LVITIDVEGRPALAYRAVTADQEWAEQMPAILTVDDVQAALLKIISLPLR
jgi:hypothetical protein